MNTIRLAVAAFCIFFATTVVAQSPEDIALIFAIGLLNDSPEASARQQAISSLNQSFIEDTPLSELDQAFRFRQTGNAPLIRLIRFMGGEERTAEVRVSFSEGSCISLQDLQIAYGVQAVPTYRQVHVLDMTSGYMKAVQVWHFELPATGKYRRLVETSLSNDDQCVTFLRVMLQP